jgi:2-amino-4-hydroxy-6-hydroxymethyldihydropteridine diphosphokinase
LLKETQTIEREMGRTHKTVDGKYSDRIIDIDILLYGDAEINLPELVVPHPRMYERDFVMKPLEEVRSH